MKQRVSLYKHGDDFFVGVHTFYRSHPGSAPTSIWELLHTPTDEELGAVVTDLLNRSGILDVNLAAESPPGSSVASSALGLPSYAALVREAVAVMVTRRGGRLMVEAMMPDGAGGGFGGTIKPVVLSDDTSAGSLAACIRQEAARAEEASAAILRPAGAWRDDRPGDIEMPSSGVVTVRKDDEVWSVTARIGARGDGQNGTASSSIVRLPAEASVDCLGQAVVDALGRAAAGGLDPTAEDPAGGESQVHVEAGELGLTIHSQLISPDTGAWEVPAHQYSRTLPRQASTSDVGQAVSLAADEVPDW